MAATKQVKNKLQVAFEQGKKAFIKGIFESPYSVNSLNHKEWQRGFDSAYLENSRRSSLVRIAS